MRVLFFAVSALALLGAGAAPKPEAESCSLATPELRKALDAVHAARDGSEDDARRVIAAWLPKTTEMLASDGEVPKEWLHLAVDLGREMVRLRRTHTPRKLFARVRELDPQGDWGQKAAAHLAELDRDR